MQGQPSCYVFGADELMLRHLGLSTWTLLSYFLIILSTPNPSLRLPKYSSCGPTSSGLSKLWRMQLGPFPPPFLKIFRHFDTLVVTFIFSLHCHKSILIRAAHFLLPLAVLRKKVLSFHRCTQLLSLRCQKVLRPFH
jgi:hypothetical protein